MFRKLIQLLFILTCWGGLALIGVQTWRFPTTTTTENRALTSKPDLPTKRSDVAPYIRHLENWWSDAIHYRQAFLRLSTIMHMKLGFNPQGEVLIGKNGWFFWTGERSADSLRNNNPLTQEEVERWRNYLLFRHLDAQRHGAKYLFIIMPNKESLYAEFMPDNFTRLSQQSWLDQIKGSVQHDGVNILDLQKVLEEGKQHAQVYTKTDTHWNSIGANYGQYEITRTLAADFPLLKPYLHPLDDFYDAEYTAFYGTGFLYYGGLPYMLGISDLTDEHEPLLKEKITKCAKHTTMPLGGWENLTEPQRSFIFHASSCKEGHYRVLLFRDSFTELLEPYLSEIFQYVAYIWTPRPNDTGMWTYFLEALHPDIVMDQMIERYLAVIPRPGIDYPKNFNPADPGTFTTPMQPAAPAEPAQQTEADIIFEKAKAFYSGSNGVLDKAKAFELFTQAANLGNSGAMFFVGVMYAQGEYVAVDKQKALAWFEKSIAAGSDAAVPWIKELKAKNAINKK